MRRRGLASPDDGDALALTFAYPVAKRDWAEERCFEGAEEVGPVIPRVAVWPWPSMRSVPVAEEWGCVDPPLLPLRARPKRKRPLGYEGRVGSGIVGASARKLSIPLPWVWYRPSWGVPVETQAVMSMPVSMAAEVANGLKRMCVIPSHAPASLRLQEARLHKLDSAGLLTFRMRCEFHTYPRPCRSAHKLIDSACPRQMKLASRECCLHQRH